MTTVISQLHLQNLLSIKKSKAKQEIKKQLEEIKNTELSDIKGIGEKSKIKLIENGIDNIVKLRELGKEGISKIITNPMVREQIFNSLNI